VARRASVVALPPALAPARPGMLLEWSAEGALVRAGEDALLIEESEAAS